MWAWPDRTRSAHPHCPRPRDRGPSGGYYPWPRSVLRSSPASGPSYRAAWWLWDTSRNRAASVPGPADLQSNPNAWVATEVLYRAVVTSIHWCSPGGLRCSSNQTHSNWSGILGRPPGPRDSWSCAG